MTRRRVQRKARGSSPRSASARKGFLAGSLTRGIEGKPSAVFRMAEQVNRAVFRRVLHEEGERIMARARRVMPGGTLRKLMARRPTEAMVADALLPVMTEEDKIRAARHAVYGDPQENHDNIAMAWTAILKSHFGRSAPVLDAQVAEIMLAAFKLVRVARPVPLEQKAFENYMDGFPDAKNYTTFAEEAAAITNKMR